MTDEPGGFLIPEALAREIGEQTMRANPFPRPEHKPLTRWERVRLSIRLLPSRAKWAIHDRFWDHGTDWDY